MVEEFVGELRSGHASSKPKAKSLVWLVEFFVEIGVTTGTSPLVPRSAQDELVDRYRRYLVDERGLARKTVIARERTVRVFLAEHPDRGLDDLDAGDVSRFVTRQCRRMSVRSAERLVNEMRSFLRFALVEGLIDVPLAERGPIGGAMDERWSATRSCSIRVGGAAGEL